MPRSSAATALLVAVLALGCGATREPADPAEAGAALGLLEAAGSAAALGAERRGGDDPEPPAPEELKAQIAEGGPLEKGMEEAVTEAKDLITAAKEWSDTSQQIQTLSEKVVEHANKSHEDLKKAHSNVEHDAEAGVKGVLQDAEKSANGQAKTNQTEEKSPDQNQDQNQEQNKEQDEEQNKGGSSLLATAVVERPEHARPLEDEREEEEGQDQNQDQNKDQNKEQDEEQDKGDTSLLATAAVERPEHARPLGEEEEEGHVSKLMESMHSKYDRLQGLLQDAASTAKDAKETAKVWASNPPKEFKQRTEEAYSVAHSVTQDVAASHQRLARAVSANVGALLANHTGPAHRAGHSH